MSWFLFVASDVELDEYCIGIQECENGIIIENENHILDIYRETFEGYPEQYTGLKHIVGVELGRYESIHNELFNYIKNAAVRCSQLEMWSIWMDDPDRDFQVRYFKEDELSEGDMMWIFNQEFFEHPRCLKMHK